MRSFLIIKSHYNHLNHSKLLFQNNKVPLHQTQVRQFAPRNMGASNFDRFEKENKDPEYDKGKKLRQQMNEELQSDLVKVETNTVGVEVQDDVQADKNAREVEEIDHLIDKDLQEKLLHEKDHYLLNREKYLEEQKYKQEEAKFGDYQARLVKRPQKNFLWGYGTRIFDEARMDDDNFFRKGKLPTIRELINFLEIYQMKEMKVVNLRALGKNEEHYAIVCSGFSMRHIYQTAKILV